MILRSNSIAKLDSICSSRINVRMFVCQPFIKENGDDISDDYPKPLLGTLDKSRSTRRASALQPRCVAAWTDGCGAFTYKIITAHPQNRFHRVDSCNSH